MMKLTMRPYGIKNVIWCFLFLTCLDSIFIEAQVSNDHINSLTKKADSLSYNLQFQKSLDLYKEANRLSILLDDTDGMIKTDFKIASLLNSLGYYKECFKYLDKIEKKYEREISKNPEY